MRFIYTLLFYLYLPIIFLKLFSRSFKTPAYRKNWSERLGSVPYAFKECVWLHAVSMGETIAAIPLIQELKKQFPDLPFLITNMTPTGRARVKAVFGETVFCSYLPYDLPLLLKRFIRKINPKILIIMETELWPNLLATCSKKNLPIILLNARLSQKSLSYYQRLFSLPEEMLSHINVIAAQSKLDADNFVVLGANKKNIYITGNLKFDLHISNELFEKSKIIHDELFKRRMIWIAASTHDGEEKIILSAHKKIKETIRNSLLILVPRHPERFDFVAKLIKENNLRLARRSFSDGVDDNIDVYLADTMGELILWYAVSQVVFVGGSLLPHLGGHNLIEPAALGKPILTGFYLRNFSEVSELLAKEKAFIQVKNEIEIAERVIHLLENEKDRKQLGANSRKVAEQNRGALTKQVQLVSSLMSLSLEHPEQSQYK